jgi:hypothetical protein
MASTSSHPFRQPGVDVSAAVRSIRIAAALSDRFAVVARPITYRSPEELSNVIGEARQLYPEIWANLDNARDALSRQGLEVAAYDALRAREAPAPSGVLEVTALDPLKEPIGSDRIQKSARMNLEGHALAIEAGNTLRRVLPNVDWDALDRAEAEEIAAAGSLRPAKWKAIVLALIGIVLLGGAAGTYVYLRVSKPAPRNKIEIEPIKIDPIKIKAFEQP